MRLRSTSFRLVPDSPCRRNLHVFHVVVDSFGLAIVDFLSRKQKNQLFSRTFSFSFFNGGKKKERIWFSFFPPPFSFYLWTTEKSKKNAGRKRVETAATPIVVSPGSHGNETAEKKSRFFSSLHFPPSFSENQKENEPMAKSLKIGEDFYAHLTIFIAGNHRTNQKQTKTEGGINLKLSESGKVLPTNEKRPKSCGDFFFLLFFSIWLCSFNWKIKSQIIFRQGLFISPKFLF